jgi:hypothetical protein
MDKAGDGFYYHLGSTLGARDSRNRVRWLNAHLLDLPAHEAYRKEFRKRQVQLEKQYLYDPSSTLSLVRKWGPSTWNIIRSMDCAATGRDDHIEEEVNEAANIICRNPSAIFERSLDIMPQNDVSSLIFLRHPPNDKDKSKHFIPTQHLRTLFEAQRRNPVNKESLFSHAAGWAICYRALPPMSLYLPT